MLINIILIQLKLEHRNFTGVSNRHAQLELLSLFGIILITLLFTLNSRLGFDQHHIVLEDEPLTSSRTVPRRKSFISSQTSMEPEYIMYSIGPLTRRGSLNQSCGSSWHHGLEMPQYHLDTVEEFYLTCFQY